MTTLERIHLIFSVNDAETAAKLYAQLNKKEGLKSKEATKIRQS